jgi:hypothetical protein
VHHPKLFPTKTTHMHKYQKDQHYELGQNVWSNAHEKLSLKHSLLAKQFDNLGLSQVVHNVQAECNGGQDDAVGHEQICRTLRMMSWTNQHC